MPRTLAPVQGDPPWPFVNTTGRVIALVESEEELDAILRNVAVLSMAARRRLEETAAYQRPA